MSNDKKRLGNWINVLYVVTIGMIGVVIGSIATGIFVLRTLNIPLW